MTYNNPMPETAFLTIDGEWLPIAPDDTGKLVGLEPVTIDWGLEHPWDTPTPAILSVTLLDPEGRWANSASRLIGKELVFTPDWNNPTAANKTNYFPVFRGPITDAKVDMSRDSPRISVTASDVTYTILNDKRTGPVEQTANSLKYNKGYQWASWTDSAFISNQLRARLASNGVTALTRSWANYSAQIESSERVSAIDIFDQWLTVGDQTVSGGTTLRIDQIGFIHCTNENGESVFHSQYCFESTHIVFAGHIIETPEMSDTDATANRFIEDAATIVEDKASTLDAVGERYGHIEIRYYSRTLTTPNATDAERANEKTWYTYSQDQSRIIDVDAGGLNTNTLQLDCRQIDTNKSVSEAVADYAVLLIRESNNRIRLPAITFHSGYNANQLRYRCFPLSLAIYASRYDSLLPLTRGRWVALAGTLTYEHQGRHGSWHNEITNLWPAPLDLTNTATIATMKAVNDTNGTYANCNWKIGLLRLVTKCANPTT